MENIEEVSMESSIRYLHDLKGKVSYAERLRAAEYLYNKYKIPDLMALEYEMSGL